MKSHSVFTVFSQDLQRMPGHLAILQNQGVCVCVWGGGGGRGAVGVTLVLSLLYIEAWAYAPSGGSCCFLIGLTAHAWAYSHNVQNLNIWGVGGGRGRSLPKVLPEWFPVVYWSLVVIRHIGWCWRFPLVCVLSSFLTGGRFVKLEAK